MSLSSLLEALGFKTENGHEIGCLCTECHEQRRRRDVEIRERIRAGKEPETLMEMLVAERRKRRKESS